jgi:hypothetical protein
VVATHIGLMLDIMYPATATALVGAELITVMIFPTLALALLGKRGRADGRPARGSVKRHTAPLHLCPLEVV